MTRCRHRSTPFPGTDRLLVAEHAEGDFDASIIMECSSLERTGVTGLDRRVVINIDHHQGNTGYGTVNWFDPSAAACAEMVYDLIVALGVPLTPTIATHLYVGILTDTGSFHYSGITSRTFDICRDPGRRRRRSTARGAGGVRQQHARPAAAVRVGAERHRARARRAGRW